MSEASFKRPKHFVNYSIEFIKVGQQWKYEFWCPGSNETKDPSYVLQAFEMARENSEHLIIPEGENATSVYLLKYFITCENRIVQLLEFDGWQVFGGSHGKFQLGTAVLALKRRKFTNEKDYRLQLLEFREFLRKNYPSFNVEDVTELKGAVKAW